MDQEGDTVIWGSYPQNLDDMDQKEPLEWIVLERRGDCILCLSKYLLDCKPYHNTLVNVEWAGCSLRKWLNNAFLDVAFSEEERRSILFTDVHNPEGVTQDRVFLLSYDEAEQYMELEERGGRTTRYARAQGSWFLSELEDANRYNGSWWLRYFGRGEEDHDAASDVISCVNYDGYIEGAAEEVNGSSCSVRPAFWKQEHNN